MAIISDTQKPPPHPFYGDSWERGMDPWHVDAFPPEILRSIDQGKLLNIGQRKGGWFLIDGYGNAISFVMDGTVIE